MKKIIAFVAAAALTASAFALDLTVGARGSFNWGLGTTLEGEMKDFRDLYDTAGAIDKESANIGGGFAAYANIGLLDLGFGSLGVQPEFSMAFNNGYTVSPKAGDDLKLYGNTIDIPVLVTLKLPLFEGFTLGVGVGPYLSIPVGLKYGNILGYDGDFDFKAVNFGAAFDVNAGYKVGPGNIVLDIRYMLDFTKTQGKVSGKSMDIFTRRGFEFGLGYEIPLNF